MDPGVRSLSPTKPSGLPVPKASRLPVLRNRSSQIYLKNPNEVSEPVKSETRKPIGQSSLSGKQISAPNAEPSDSVRKAHAAASKSFSQRNGTLRGNPSPAANKTPSSSRPGVVRPSSRHGPQELPTLAADPSPITHEEEEHHDQLGSLDSFRSASRQGLLEPSPPDLTEYVEQPAPEFTPKPRKQSRPSLSDRTIDALSQLQMTPKERRRSSFFAPPESPMGPPSRPASALSRGNSSNSRPGTSDGSFSKPLARPLSPAKNAPGSAKPSTRTSGFGFTPGNANRRSVSAAFTNRPQAPSDSVSPSPRLSTLAKPPQSSLTNGTPTERPAQRPLTGSKTLSARPTKPRPALGGVFAKPKAGPPSSTEPTRRGTDHDRKHGEQTSVASNATNSSSAVLRQQIAAAKAAAKKVANVKPNSDQNAGPGDGAFDVDIVDPFNQGPKDGKHILRNRIISARTDGRLNIAAMDLKQIPAEVIAMYDTTSILESGASSWEICDLARFIAADNELEEIPDELFPDIDPQTVDQDMPFAGLEAIDLHGNQFQTIPMGLRQMTRLTSLNLAHNKLANSALDVISQINTLKELKLGHNSVSLNLPPALCRLQNLETLDLQANRLLSLPEALRELISLKVLNISGNQLTSLPMDAIHELPLVELDASSNALIGSLFPLGGANAGHRTLRSLSVANNSLAALTFSEALSLPAIRTLDITNNHIVMLPDVSCWTELTTLAAADNKIPELPPGLVRLMKLRNVNLTSNDLRVLDPEIARMKALESLILASNPLREKKYLTMSGADIKRDLKAKLEPDVQEEEQEGVIPEGSDDFSSAATGVQTSKWTLKSGGLLDLASKNLSDDSNDMLGSFLKANDVRQLHLQLNRLTAIPPALWLGQDLRVLDLAGNLLGSEYLSEDLSLPALQDLNISSCRLTTLEPLTTHLEAPSLQHLNVSANRLSGVLPALRAFYPALTTFLASDNKYTSISADALQGLSTVNLSSNNIAQLPAEIGLLWNEGLRCLEVGSNAFRVPSYRVLEKGTEATMRWLRDRIPADHEGEEVNGDGHYDSVD